MTKTLKNRILLPSVSTLLSPIVDPVQYRECEYCLLRLHYNGWEEANQKAKRVMNQIQGGNILSRMKKSAVTGWQSLKSYFSGGNGRRNRNIGGTEMKAGPSQSDLRGSTEQLPQFKQTRRTAICSVIEEKDQRHGISLAELRSELIVRQLLVKNGML